jgi:hypothetical protein
MTTSQIDQQEVQIAPSHLLKKLANDLVQHRAAHDHWLVTRRDQANGNHLYAVRGVGLNLVALENAGLLGRAHHQRNIGPVDVGVNQSDAVAKLGESYCHVNGQRGFTDSAFA